MTQKLLVHQRFLSSEFVPNYCVMSGGETQLEDKRVDLIYFPLWATLLIVFFGVTCYGLIISILIYSLVNRYMGGRASVFMPFSKNQHTKWKFWRSFAATTTVLVMIVYIIAAIVVVNLLHWREQAVGSLIAFGFGILLMFGSAILSQMWARTQCFWLTLKPKDKVELRFKHEPVFNAYQDAYELYKLADQRRLGERHHGEEEDWADKAHGSWDEELKG